MGLKTTYYLRTLAASQVEKSTVNTNEFGSTHTRKIDACVTSTQSQASAPSTAATTIKQSGAALMAQAVAQAGHTPTDACKIADPSCESCQ